MKSSTTHCGCGAAPAASTTIQPGTIIWGCFPSHDRGDMWHPAIVLRVIKDTQRTVITAALGTSRRVYEDHQPTELVCFADEAEFRYTGLSTSTRFNMGGLRFSFELGSRQEQVIGEIHETRTPVLYRRLILACKSTTL